MTKFTMNCVYIFLINLILIPIVYSELPDKTEFCKEDGIVKKNCKSTPHLYCEQSASTQSTPGGSDGVSGNSPATGASDAPTTAAVAVTTANAEPPPRFRRQSTTEIDMTNFLKLILDKHNTYRSVLFNCEQQPSSVFNAKGERLPPPMNLLKLSWDDDLQKVASLKAQTCNIETVDCPITDKFLSTGQNKYLKGCDADPKDETIENFLKETLKTWFLEYLSIDKESLQDKSHDFKIPDTERQQILEKYPDIPLESLNCSSHFKNLASDQAQVIGCAVSKCGKKDDHEESLFLVCNYGQEADKFNPEIKHVYDFEKEELKCSKDRSHCCLCIPEGSQDSASDNCDKLDMDLPPIGAEGTSTIESSTTEISESSHTEETSIETTETTLTETSGKTVTETLPETTSGDTEETTETDEGLETSEEGARTDSEMSTGESSADTETNISEGTTESVTTTNGANFRYSKLASKIFLISLYIL